jgi:hypothetical protein
MVSAISLRLLSAVGVLLLAVMLGIARRYYFSNADRLCQRFAEGAEKMPKLLRLLSPPSFFRGRYAVWQLRSSGIAAILMGCVLPVIALLTLFTHQ